mmetsp:Transcript_1718/g.3778  ORF Transcript_1718/g.3778 Transcript_1718/m.3778 type:complete len:252 (+) Transcript_1718:69-824(+)
MNPPLSQSKHACLGTNSLTLCPTCIHHFLRNRKQINIPQQIHLTRMNLHNRHTVLRIRIGELNLPINTTGTQQGRIQNINPIRRHDHLDILRGFKPIQLIQQLQHGALHLGISSARTSSTARLTDGIDFVHEDNARCRFPSHDEEFPHHPGPLPNVLLDQFGTADADEGTIRMVGHGPGQEGFARSRRSVEEDSLGLGDSQTFEQFGVFDREFDDFFDFHDLFFEAADHVVSGVGDCFDFHEGDERVDLRG